MRSAIRNRIRSVLWRAALKRYECEKPFVIAVGGSVGKTSAKEAIATLLEQSDMKVVKTLENLATDFGVPLSLMGYSELPNGVGGWLRVILTALTYVPRRQKQVVYVLEYSVDSPGDTKFLTSKIRPNAVVMTAITPVHMEQFGTEESMRNETVALITPLCSGEKVYANWNDPVQRQLFTKEWLAGREVHWYGVVSTVPKRSGTWAINVESTKNGLRFQLQTNESVSSGKEITQTVETRVIAEYQLAAILAACAISVDRGLSATNIREGVQEYQLPAGRGRLIPGRRNVTIIDDSANSSPEAVLAGLAALKQFATERSKRAVAIIGSMNELGERSDDEHQRVARQAAKEGAVLIAVGQRAHLMAKAALLAGAPEGSVMAFSSPEHLMQSLDQVVRRGDVVFVKASQNGMFLERVVKLLMADPNRANELLVRQGRAWARRHT